MTDLNPNTSITILNIDGLNISIKRQRLSEKIFKHQEPALAGVFQWIEDRPMN